MKPWAIILAAGAASRMQLDGAYRSKALLTLPDRGQGQDEGWSGQTKWLPALEILVRTYRQAGINGIMLVSGFHHAETEGLARELGLVCVRNEDPDRGMFSSVCTALRHLPACEAFFVHPVDVPLARARTLLTLLDAARNSPDTILLPTCGGEDGHPPLIPACYRETILNHDGQGGLAGILPNLPLRRVEVDDHFILEDMDTREDHARLCYLAAHANSGSQPATPRLCLLRHGLLASEPDPASGHRFVGASDLPLSASGQRQIARLARDLEPFLLDPALVAVITSALRRSRQSGQILLEHARRQGRADLVMQADPAFNEISLGRWEGLGPSQVKARFPGQYEARGRDVANFCPPEGESFARVQQRVLAALDQWQGRYPGRSLLLVAHAGVNRCLLAHFLAMPLSGFARIDEFLALPQTYAAHCYLPLPL